MICKLELKFEGRNVYGPTKMDKWEEFLIKDSDEDKIENVRFPKLETLLLDFEAWQLHWDHRLVVSYLLLGLSLLDTIITNKCLSSDSSLRLYVSGCVWLEIASGSGGRE